MNDELLLRLRLRVKLDQLLLSVLRPEFRAFPAFSHGDVVP